MNSTGKNQFLLGVERALRRAGVEEGASLLAGISGGADSTALLAALAGLAPRLGFRLAACTVDHGIRADGSAAADLQAVQFLAETLHVRLYVRVIPAGQCAAAAKARRLSLEETARDIRHTALEDARGEAACDWIALGHTLDDQAETMAMRFFQGCGISGLKGIPARRGRIVRPLLAVTRTRILQYLTESDLGFRADPMNDDRRFLRTRVRHRLLPVVEEIFPGYRRSLAACGERLAAIDDQISLEADRSPAWQQDGEGIWASRRPFFRCSIEARMRALFAAYDRLRDEGMPRRLPARFLHGVRGGDPGTPRAVLADGHGVRLLLDGARVSLRRSIVTTGKKGYLILVKAGGSYPLKGTAATVRCLIRKGDGSREGEVCVPVEGSGSPCVLRSRRPGDSLPCGQRSLSLKKLYNQGRIPEDHRWMVPVVAGKGRVLAVLGGAFGARDMVGRMTGQEESRSWICFRVQRR